MSRSTVADDLERATQRAGRIPGEPGIWVFVLADMTVFGAFFVVFLVVRLGQPEVFAASRPSLEVGLGLVNTLVLITSSVLVALGVRRARDGQRGSAARLVTAGMACGLAFLVIKVIEYSLEVAAGVVPTTNDFFMYYFVLTGIHAAHVIMGLGGLAAVRRTLGRPRPGPHDLRTAETGATFWHMVDALWIVLFPLLYLAA
ncbi:cytochrome c oxidase subunit 3 family protein [Actinomycetospora endophytica]|uniref:Cytochrome aa3 subunit 3 n=1 Tax=Actinomycetospora endophytica TaxID=2291215 RepID=A0ABS8PC29_9PSEU|nr:cytochrome c oxidase subunit 3 family protein [Actinomycetospora endophytica]MCD2195807.1 cytochrome c oxidase subunit 3 family protein [Actinomycetospora endophytica]